MKKKIFFIIPLTLFFVMVAFLIVGLQLDPRKVPSPLIGKQIPQFNLLELSANETFITNKDLPSTPYLLNVWASWCGACLEEHRLLKQISELGSLKIVGLNYKDDYSEATKWLLRYGDPYIQKIFDPEARLGLNLGVYGVPETFLIDESGTIVYKHIGPLTFETYSLLLQQLESKKL
ncbi:MAG: hypothetical protein CBC29_08720 [Methylococcaceae bacterium TMED69]|nr:MAG: hypothetical protein CBC29_08720 [Methylococcaceae bacterium TMED69]